MASKAGVAACDGGWSIERQFASISSRPSASKGSDTTRSRASQRPRRDLRVEFPFAVLIRWQDRSGQRFEFSTVLDSLTPTEVELRLDRPILGNRRPLLVIRLAREAADPALRLAFLGTVQRIEPLPDGCWSHTITFTRYRFLYAVPPGPGTSAPGS